MENKIVVDSTCKHGKACRGWGLVLNSKNDFIEGFVSTPYGLVRVYSQGDENNTYHSSFRFVLNGNEYIRTINRRYKKRGLTSLAGKFAKEICHG